MVVKAGVLLCGSGEDMRCAGMPYVSAFILSARLIWVVMLAQSGNVNGTLV